MTTKNEPLPSIQARIEELQNTIVEKEKQIKSRALHLSDNLKAEIAPIEIVKKYARENVRHFLENSNHIKYLTLVVFMPKLSL